MFSLQRLSLRSGYFLKYGNDLGKVLLFCFVFRFYARIPFALTNFLTGHGIKKNYSFRLLLCDCYGYAYSIINTIMDQGNDWLLLFGIRELRWFVSSFLRVYLQICTIIKGLFQRNRIKMESFTG